MSGLIIPAGWHLVPLDPTETMLDDSYGALREYIDRMRRVQPCPLVAAGPRGGFHVPLREKHRVRWRAMCAVAPRPETGR